MTLKIEAVAKPELLELVLANFATAIPAHLTGELLGALLYQPLVVAVVPVHGPRSPGNED